MIKEIVHDIVFLQQKALPAFPGDRQTALDLLDTLAAHRQECVGMAANMIGIPKAIIVVNLGLMDLIMFNPVILKKEHPYETEEGCLSLSLSGTRKTTRYREIQVEFQDMEFKKQKQTFKDFPAEIIQHEMDHLQGIVI
ncbi:peptide deformylase [Acidaminococcus massiliensis]|uniref:peptide deformylase n=1 Tax=Acidaminococcus massiliensis TaxID=1852375 RepID=UPI00094E7F37|nr:peptide deformylase [Acidaminococcus massiliensis]